MEKLLHSVLRTLAIWTLKKYKPVIIGVTGSVGKTSTKEAIWSVLRNNRFTRRSQANFNNEIGLPLTILGDWDHVGGVFFWLKVVLSSLGRLFIRYRYPEVLVLEYGASKPGDMRYLLDIARPTIGIITAVGEMPVHVEFYSSPEAVAREKAKLVEQLPASGFAILNFDEEVVRTMQEKTRAQVMTFGFEEGADVRLASFETKMEDEKPMGVAFKIDFRGSMVPVRLNHSFGRSQAYAAGAAAAVGLALGMHLVHISENLSDYSAPAQRLKLVPGIKDTTIIDDSYNASPLSMKEGFETVRSLTAKRKVAVLGDMLELGKYSVEAHEAVGYMVPKVFEVLVAVGPRAKFIADIAQKNGMPEKNILTFATSNEAAKPVQNLLRKGDLVFVKASHGIHLERVIEEIKDVTIESKSA